MQKTTWVPHRDQTCSVQIRRDRTPTFATLLEIRTVIRPLKLRIQAGALVTIQHSIFGAQRTQIRQVIKTSGSKIGDANSVAAVGDRRTNLSGKGRRS